MAVLSLHSNLKEKVESDRLDLSPPCPSLARRPCHIIQVCGVRLALFTSTQRGAMGARQQSPMVSGLSEWGFSETVTFCLITGPCVGLDDGPWVKC